jgi:hippurate hydrolase
VNASTDEFVIELAGPGGHAARPHETVDPIVAGSLIVSALQGLVERSVEPSQAAVVSVGQFDAGTASNIIASRARLRGTLRALEPAVRAQLLDAVRQIADSAAGAQGVSATLEIVAATPAVLNAPQATSLARDAAALVVGPGGVKPLRWPNLGGEDFGFFLERVPGCYVRFGAHPAGEGFPAHSSRFRFDEQALALGAAYFYHVAVRAGRALAQG